jgi:hypothetical protein
MGTTDILLFIYMKKELNFQDYLKIFICYVHLLIPGKKPLENLLLNVMSVKCYEFASNNVSLLSYQLTSSRKPTFFNNSNISLYILITL